MTPDRIPEPIPDAEPDFGSGPAPGYKPPYPPEYAPEDDVEAPDKPDGLPEPPLRPDEDPPVPPVPSRDPGDRPPPPRPAEEPPMPPPDPKPGDAAQAAGRDEPSLPLPPSFHLPPGHRPLADFARIVRSKNRSPFELSLDVICRSERDFNALHNSGAFTAPALAAAYNVAEDDVLDLVWYRPALAVKAVLRRAVPSGAPGDTDVYGVQQHGPLLRMTIPV